MPDPVSRLEDAQGWGWRMTYFPARPSSGQPSTTLAVLGLKPTPDENLAITAALPVRRYSKA